MNNNNKSVYYCCVQMNHLLTKNTAALKHCNKIPEDLNGIENVTDLLCYFNWVRSICLIAEKLKIVIYLNLVWDGVRPDRSKLNCTSC